MVLHCSCGNLLCVEGEPPPTIPCPSCKAQVPTISDKFNSSHELQDDMRDTRPFWLRDYERQTESMVRWQADGYHVYQSSYFTTDRVCFMAIQGVVVGRPLSCRRLGIVGHLVGQRTNNHQSPMHLQRQGRNQAHYGRAPTIPQFQSR